MKPIINIAAYKFVTLSDLPEKKAYLKDLCITLQLKGTILLSSEGINIMLAGTETAIATFKLDLTQQQAFQDLIFKESRSSKQPFKRLLVKIKKEVITLGLPHICPTQKTGPKISPEQLKQWFDEGKDFTLLDTRNKYEIAYGTFEGAIDLNLKHFREFPKTVTELAERKNKPMVMFCTGGIRCEKASLLLLENGFTEVYQLDGGILNYFAKCGGEHYQGNCFVFDERVAVDTSLNEIN